MGSGDGLVIHSHNSHDRCRVWRWMKWEEGRSATAWEWNFTSSCWQETNSLWTRYHNKTVTRPNFGVFSKSWKTSKSDLTYLLYIYILYIYNYTYTCITHRFWCQGVFRMPQDPRNDLEDFEVSPKESTRWPDMAPQNNRRIRHGSSLGVPMGPRIAGPAGPV